MNRMWNKCHIDLKHTILYVGWDFQVFDLVYYNGMHIMSLLMTAIETKKMIDDKKNKTNHNCELKAHKTQTFKQNSEKWIHMKFTLYRN